MSENLARVLEQIEETASKRPQHKFNHQFYRHPYLDAAAINQTITVNYHNAIEKYKAYCDERNYPVKLHNEIMTEREKKKQRNTPLLTLLFKRECRRRKIATTQVNDPEDYNNFVIEFNQEHGTHLKMKKWQPIKMGHDPVFATMVKYYAAQLRDFMKSKEANTANGIVILPQLRTNSWKITQHKVDGIKQVFLDPETVRRQIKRLDAAGIIQHFNRGADSNFGAYFNPEILDIQHRSKVNNTDETQENTSETAKSQKSENQLTKGGKTTKCRVWDYSLPEPTEKSQKEKQFATAQERNEPHGSTVKPRNICQNTQSDPKNKIEPGAKNVKVIQLPDFLATAQNRGIVILDQPQNETSAALNYAIEPNNSLAADLAAHKYDSYKPLDSKLLEWESMKGTMSDEEFLMLASQDFAKDFARLYQSIDQHYKMTGGHWFNFLEYVQNDIFKTFTGRAMNKKTVFDKLVMMRRMIKRAVSSFSRKGNKNYPCFPSDYILRTHYVSFWNLEKRIEESDRQVIARKLARKNRPEEQQRLLKFKAREIRDKRKAKRVENDHKKAMKAVRFYLKNEHQPGAYEKLFWYVKDNLLKQFSEDLGRLIDNERNAL